jgi:microcin C transport system permease protein
MGAYILRRLLLMIPTILGIMAISFAVVQFAPGGPVERVIAQLSGQGGDALDRLSGGGGDFGQNNLDSGSSNSKYRGAQGLDPQFIADLEKQFGFDKPPLERFGQMLWNYMRFDFGRSYFRDISVIDLIKEKMPVSISLGLWLTFLSYLISIPLGIRKAIKEGTRFDTWTSAIIIVGYAIPSFLFAILLIVLFAGGSFFDWFPLRGLTSSDFAQMSIWGKIGDYLWHMVLPVTALVLSAFATTTLLTKNSFLEEIRKGTDRTSGALPPCVPQCHADRNCWFSGRLHLGILHWLTADRNDLLARWSGASWLSVDHQPRLSGSVCQPVYFLADRAFGRAFV